MLNALTTYQYEDEAPLRVVMVEGKPWWVANDLAKLLGYRNAPDMTRMLPEHWAGTHIVRSGGQNRTMTIVNEAGMWKVVSNSRRAEAMAIQEWLFGEVLPAIRKHGEYRLPGREAPPPALDGPRDEHDTAYLSAAVGVIREARHVWGPVLTRDIWIKLGLPAPIADAEGDMQADELVGLLRRAVDGLSEASGDDLLDALAVPQANRTMGMRQRVGAAIRLMGWRPIVRRVNGRPRKLWAAPERLGPAPVAVASVELEG